MEAQVRTPQMVFMQPQRLVVPLFQRPYVWNEQDQWEPLWADVVRVAERLLHAVPGTKQQPHFLGAVVLQQLLNPIGLMQQRTIIDGQQRLTTLQLLLDALRSELLAIEARPSAMRIESLVTNQEHFRERSEDQFKVWPTNRDRAGFNAVMRGVAAPANERIPEAHRFFRESAREWLLADGPEVAVTRGTAIEAAMRDHLQMVVIDLAADENAQEIFETLNARGAQLTAADLIKNFIFQRLLEAGTNVEHAYEAHWKEFETAFWETEVAVGRLRYPRSSLFLNQWLIARTGEEIVARQVFARFKTFADYEAQVAMPRLLEQVHRAATVYRAFIDGAVRVGPVNRLELFGYRTGVLESEVIKPFVLHLLDPEEPPVPELQFVKALEVMESWMVRRMLVRATTKSYSRFMADLIAHLRRSDRSAVGDILESYLTSQKSAAQYWPDDAEVREEMQSLLAYRRLGRSRLRMLLEAIEDHLRGWSDGKQGLGGERVARGQYAIEHVMPRKWAAHWPIEGDAVERDRIIHTLGNLTLLMSKLNSKVSNAPWLGEGGKRSGLEKHDVLHLNRDLLKSAPDVWNEELIRKRAAGLTELILRIWPVPAGHRSGFAAERLPRVRKWIRLSDLLTAGLLSGVTTLYPRSKKHQHRHAALLPDGTIEIDDQIFDSPSPAAVYITGRPTNGWSFFAIDPSHTQTLKSIRRDYINDIAVEVEEDDDDDEDDDS